jgi:hypothetical protein
MSITPTQPATYVSESTPVVVHLGEYKCLCLDFSFTDEIASGDSVFSQQNPTCPGGPAVSSLGIYTPSPWLGTGSARAAGVFVLCDATSGTLQTGTYSLNQFIVTTSGAIINAEPRIIIEP